MRLSFSDDVIETLSLYYHKAIRANLATDTFEIIKVEENEKVSHNKLNKWFLETAAHGYIHPADKGKYLEYANVYFLRDYFETHNSCEVCYRRKITKTDYIWMSLKMVKSCDYTPAHPYIYILLRNIASDVESIVTTKEEREEIKSYDKLQAYLYDLHDKIHPVSIGVIALDNLEEAKKIEGRTIYEFPGGYMIFILGEGSDVFQLMLSDIYSKLPDANIQSNWGLYDDSSTSVMDIVDPILQQEGKN